MKEKYYRVWADINLDAIRSNITRIQEGLKKGTKTCAVIKADGYGHGAVYVSKNIDDLVDYYAVATIDEGMELRAAGTKKPILVLGYVHPSLAEEAARNQIRLTVYDYDTAKAISQTALECGQQVLVHIKADTGMSRIGFAPVRDSVDTVLQIRDLPGIQIEGLFTHFANADADTPDQTLDQLKKFRDFAAMLQEAGLSIPVKHCSNSAAATWLRDADMDMVRLGISMYGLYPSPCIHQIPLEPALSLKSHVIMVKEIAPGTSVGYGSTWTAQETRTIATIPAGYADGYNRSLSNKGSVLIRGQRFPVVGRVCMDQIMVDVTGSKEAIRQGDEVILIGTSQDQVITAEEVGDLAGSFNYELVCGFGRRVPRRYYRDGICIATKNIFDEYYD